MDIHFQAVWCRIEFQSDGVDTGSLNYTESDEGNLITVIVHDYNIYALLLQQYQVADFVMAKWTTKFLPAKVTAVIRNTGLFCCTFCTFGRRGPTGCT